MWCSFKADPVIKMTEFGSDSNFSLFFNTWLIPAQSDIKQPFPSTQEVSILSRHTAMLCPHKLVCALGLAEHALGLDDISLQCANIGPSALCRLQCADYRLHAADDLIYTNIKVLSLVIIYFLLQT